MRPFSLQPWIQGLVQTQGDVSILSGVRPGLVQRHLVEGQLALTLAGNILIVDSLVSQVLERQRIHVVPRTGAVQHVGLQHRVKANSLEFDTVVQEYRAVILEILSDLGPIGIFQQLPQLLQHRRPQ